MYISDMWVDYANTEFVVWEINAMFTYVIKCYVFVSGPKCGRLGLVALTVLNVNQTALDCTKNMERKNCNLLGYT